MPKVFNWQLNREMDYRFEEARVERQWAAVFNINRCIGCQTCSIACKSTWTFSEGQEYMWWNNVETKPYGGYPQFWDRKILDKLGPQTWDGDTYTGETIFEAAPEGEEVLGYRPTPEEFRFPNIYEDTPAHQWQETTELPEHGVWMFYLQRTCNHCTYPACLAACPRQAIYKRPEDGVVLIDQERCRGYQKCVEGCPYKKSMYRPTTRTSEKCIACYPINEAGGIMSRCMRACVGKIRMQGYTGGPENFDPENPIDYMVHVAKVALPLYPQFGLEPNLYYIPPRWAPRDYLKQLFGPGVEDAIAKYTDPDKTLFGLLRLFGASEQILAKFIVNDNFAIGYNEAGHEAVRVPLDEPFFIRPEFDRTHSVQRVNEP